MTREYARGPSGERVVGIVPRNRGVVLTVVGAVALDGVRAMMAYEGGTSAEAFLRFVREALAPSLHKGDVVVLDNLGAHRAVGVREAIETVGARLLYLPPYHPELNPIELAWSKMKALLKRIGARDLHALACARSSRVAGEGVRAGGPHRRGPHRERVTCCRSHRTSPAR